MNTKHSTATAKINAAVIAKLAVEGLTLASPWDAIEACLTQVVSPTACIRAARTLHHVNEAQ